MQERYIRALVQKANEMNDGYLANEKLVRMIVSKNSQFNYDDRIENILKALVEIKNNATMS